MGFENFCFSGFFSCFFQKKCLSYFDAFLIFIFRIFLKILFISIFSCWFYFFLSFGFFTIFLGVFNFNCSFCFCFVCVWENVNMCFVCGEIA